MSPRRHDYSDTVTYSQAHLRMKTDRGRADTYSCVKCEGPAREWAYLGGCPNEIDDGSRKYSLDQARYVPMCVSCHRRHDRALADGRSTEECPKGHLWAENTVYRLSRKKYSGLRYCRTCHREQGQATKDRRRLAQAA